MRKENVTQKKAEEAAKKLAEFKQIEKPTKKEKERASKAGEILQEHQNQKTLNLRGNIYV